MQPKNYWQNDSNKSSADVVTGMYTPEPITDDSTPIKAPEAIITQKTVIDDEPVHWSASEYIHKDKNVLWFVLFTVVVVALIALDIIIIKSYTFSLLVFVMALAVVVYARRPPRSINYTLSGNQGLYIGETLHHFSEFKAFGLINDNGQHSIMLIPIKRFSLGLSVYFPEEVGEKIIDILGARLPMKPLNLDAIDIIVRKLRL
jgi:hypothetical protein